MYNINNYNYKVRNVQANLVSNSGFETPDSVDPTQPADWWNDTNAGSPTFSYTDFPGRTGSHAASIDAVITSTGYWAQTIPITGGNYTLSAYAQLTGVDGQVYLGIDWFDSTDSYISGSTSTTILTGTVTNWTSITMSDTAPTDAVSANIILILDNSTGTVAFDDVSFTGGASSPGCTAQSPCSPTCTIGYCQQGTCSSTGQCITSGCTAQSPCSPTCTIGYCQQGTCSSTGQCVTTPTGCTGIKLPLIGCTSTTIAVAGVLIIGGIAYFKFIKK